MLNDGCTSFETVYVTVQVLVGMKEVKCSSLLVQLPKCNDPSRISGDSVSGRKAEKIARSSRCTPWSEIPLPFSFHEFRTIGYLNFNFARLYSIQRRMRNLSFQMKKLRSPRSVIVNKRMS